MHVIILMKQVPDTRQAVTLRSNGTIDRERTKNVSNPYDKNALEAALQVKDKLGARVTVISMGPPQAVEVLREALAMGADDAVLLCDRRLAGSDTLATSYALSRTIKKVGNYDMIFCGMETADGNTAQVGPEVAEFLNIPQITYVEDFKIDGDSLEAKRLIEGGYERLRTKLPALLTITSTANEPRYPSVLAIIRAGKKTIPTWNLEDAGVDESRVGLKGSPTRLRRIDKPRARGVECVLFEEEELEVFLDRLRRDAVKLVQKR